MTEHTPNPAGSSPPPADATANAPIAESETLCLHRPEAAAADESVRPGRWPQIDRERLIELRENLVKTAEAHAGKGDTTNFRKWRKAKEGIREVDALLAKAGKDQPE